MPTTGAVLLNCGGAEGGPLAAGQLAEAAAAAGALKAGGSTTGGVNPTHCSFGTSANKLASSLPQGALGRLMLRHIVDATATASGTVALGVAKHGELGRRKFSVTKKAVPRGKRAP